jgi:uncharacterized paraquat-inducible protein A
MSSFLQEPGGYPDDILIGTHSSTLDCNICLKVMRDPVRACKNDHYNCHSCLTEQMQINKKECPVCRIAIPEKKQFSIARAINTMILELPVKCHFDHECILGN